MINAPQKMANLKLATFNKKVADLMKKFPVIKGDPLKILKMALKKWEHYADRRPKFVLKTITPQKMLEHIKKWEAAHPMGMTSWIHQLLN